VLRHFEGERTARAIGAELCLSINTVKTHIRAIYRKLGVATREDALARAGALGMLDA
jgi:LuxR family maltose regulon positive regulatory protein